VLVNGQKNKMHIKTMMIVSRTLINNYEADYTGHTKTTNTLNIGE
jgi:hypothetical protein